jgi:hypothetical protein
LSTTLVKFEKNHGTLDEEWKKKTPLLPMIIINMFERIFDTFRRSGRKNPMLLTTLGQFALIYHLFIYLKKWPWGGC